MTTVTTQSRRPANPVFELLSPVEFGVFAATSPFLRRAPKDRRQPVMVLPGFVAADGSTLAMRMTLRRLGHRAVGWKLGRNLGPTQRTLDGILRRLQEEAARAGQPISLVGWSLGGIYARLLAQEHPDLVRQVISLGSPFNIGLAEDTTVSPLWDLLDRRGHFVRDRDSVDLNRIPVPSTSIFTKTDGIVSWQSCLQTTHSEAENVQVLGSHCGLGVNVAAIAVIADRLAQRPGTWRPFAPKGTLAKVYPVRRIR